LQVLFSEYQNWNFPHAPSIPTAPKGFVGILNITSLWFDGSSALKLHVVCEKGLGFCAFLC